MSHILEHVRWTAPSFALACDGVILFPDVACTLVLLHECQTTAQHEYNEYDVYAP